MDDDSELLRRYAEEKSEAAFAELVRRNLNVVFAAAMRQVGDSHRAEEIVQSVFTDLARKAGSLWRRPVLVSWLFTSTRYAATKTIRAEQRRHAREQEAMTMHNLLPQESETDWNRLQPILDEVLHDLADRDREAILLRYFKDLPFAEIGRSLRINEESARQRVGRALDKMHARLAKRGVTSTAAALAVALANQVAAAAPAGLAATVTNAALVSAAAVPAGTATLLGALNFATASKVTIGVFGVVALFAVGVIVSKNLEAHQTPAPEAQSTHSPSLDSAKLLQDTRLAESLVSTPASPAADTTSLMAVENPTREGRIPSDAVGSASTPELTGGQQTRRNARQDARRDAKTRAATVRRLAPLFEKLSLTPQQEEKLIQLVTNDHEAGLDFAAANARVGTDISDDPEAFWAATHAARADLRAEIRTLLGEAGYALFLANDLSARQSAVVENFQKRLTPATARLNDDQSRQLLSVLQELRTFQVEGEVLVRARAFLSPEQIEALVVERQRQTSGSQKEAVQKTILRNLPNAPAESAAGK